MKITRVFSYLLFIFLISCGDSNSSPDSSGEEHQKCKPDRVCNSGLVCAADDICIKEQFNCGSCISPQVCNRDQTACVDPSFNCSTCVAPQICNREQTACIDPVNTLQKGDITITEVMAESASVNDLLGEWFEIYNTTDQTIDLKDLVIVVNDRSYHIFQEGKISPRKHFVFTVSTLATIPYDMTGSFSLPDDGATLTIKLNEMELDTLIYPEAVSGVSWQRDDHNRWCFATSKISRENSDLGTPQKGNSLCVTCDSGATETRKCDQFNNNLNGVETRSCLAGVWGVWGRCVDPDICENSTVQTGSCGLNNRGTRSSSCIDGQWDAWGECDDSDICKNGEYDEQSCDHLNSNNNGTQKRVCSSGEWGEWRSCDDPDICENSTTQNQPCGLNSNGNKTRTCIDGQWGEWGVCNDSDSCQNGIEQQQNCDTLNNNNNGIQTRVCHEGVWGDWGSCDDPDLCENDTTNQRSCDTLNSNNNGDQFRTCIDGQWGDWGSCNDPDLCIIDQLETQRCTTLSGSEGHQTRSCIDGQWSSWEACFECYSGEINIPETPQLSCSNGYAYQICHNGEWNHNQSCSTYNWKRELSPSSIINDLAVTSDQKYLYATGYRDQSATSTFRDPFLVKYNIHGEKLWDLQWGTAASNSAYDIAIDRDGYIFVVGDTDELLGDNLTDHLGGTDIFITKISPSGTIIWSKQWGSDRDDRARGIKITSDQHLLIVGTTEGIIDPDFSAKDGSILVTKLNLDGEMIWHKQHGDAATPLIFDVVIDSHNTLHILTRLFNTYLLKIDQSGKIQKETEIVKKISNYSLTIDSSDQLYIGGYIIYDNFTKSNPYIKTLNINHETIATYNPTTTTFDKIHSLHQGGDGSIYALEIQSGTTLQKLVLYKITPDLTVTKVRDTYSYSAYLSEFTYLHSAIVNSHTLYISNYKDLLIKWSGSSTSIP